MVAIVGVAVTGVAVTGVAVTGVDSKCFLFVGVDTVDVAIEGNPTAGVIGVAITSGVLQKLILHVVLLQVFLM